ncbi:sarcosine oxidase subunit gamma [uncultured Sulfitobacter sp.]|uniref:sarcosine oxidase subunit gamma n=1 Tax=uncultured Sulfitobacter sp. TaxID=191468 RepID=UPI0026392D64|nr:sarcosine oxidase subunit gamma [uncultured Sulfitobacter sp.]
MDKLQAVSPCAGLLPITIGALTVEEVDMWPITSVTPFSGASGSVLGRALGMPFPAPLQSTTDGDARLVWAGRGEALLMGAVPDANLGAYAAVVDQSDAWAVVTLTGTGGADALARLVPVDMRLSAFGVGASVRSQLGHMNASITRLDGDTFMIAVFRSMAGTLVHDLARALEAVAARG